MSTETAPDGKYLKLDWRGVTDRFLIEAAMIRAGGKITVAGQEYGHGIFYHYKQAITALWPHFEWHQWSELLIKTFSEQKEVGVMGPASSGKTYCSAAWSLCTFWVWHVGTSIIMSSTTREGLQLRVWGSIKSLFKKAKERRPWLHGRIIESRNMLTAADGDDEAQDFRDGIIGVACFLPGTMVDTPHGKVAIESLKIGDEVLNASGVGTVLELHTRISKKILRVTISDGRTIECTEEHPFLTDRGWVKAVDLKTFDMVFSASETLQILRGEFERPVSKPELVFQGMQRFPSGAELLGMRKAVQAEENLFESKEEHWPFLREGVRRDMGVKETGTVPEKSTMQELRKGDEWSSPQPALLLGAMPELANPNAMQGMRKVFHFHKGESGKAKKRVLRSVLQAEIDAENQTQVYDEAYTGGVDCVENVPRIHLEHAHSNGSFEERRVIELVQTGFGISPSEAGCRNRWRNSQAYEKHLTRSKKNPHFGGAWVDRVEVLEPRGSEGTRSCKAGHTVHNIAVSGHPSYSVNGVIVHNCKVGGQFVGIQNYVGLKNDRVILVADEASLMERGFVDAISNLRKNPVFKAIVMGNPKDRTDPLGIVCEPHTSIGGWEGLTQEEKTTTWKTRAGGMAVQLCGFDSPNYRYPRGLNPFRGLIKPEDIEADIAYYGRDSLQFSMMNLGMMPKDGGLRRVITMSLCESHGALEEVIWSDANQLTDILALDAAYSGVGGDRCPLIHLRYGPTVSGLVKIAVVSIQNIPVKPGAEESPEDQIVRYVMMMAKTLNVPPGRTGFDSTGRGTLMSSFARLWSPDVIPIEFGGMPSKTRTVRADSQQTEAEAFGKQVSALWFASRHLIEARQLGQLTREIVEDGACREWGITKTGKQDVEPKDKTKLRMGRSPDLWDSLVTGIEVARRNGFQIAAGNSVGVTKRRTPNWLKEMASRNQALDQSHSLTY